MKTLLLFVFLLSSSITLNAQYYPVGPYHVPISKYQVLGQATFKFTYQFTHIFDVKDTINSRRSDLHVLLVNNSISKYYSQQYGDYCTKALINKTIGLAPTGTCSFEIFKNYLEGKLTEIDMGGENWVGGTFMYQEDLPAFDWKIQTDTMTILTHVCQKATTSFRGRDYIAWFASDIPICNGPWKLGGLPGLILNAEDSKNEVTFHCVGIEKLMQQEPIKLYDLRYTQTSRKKLNDIFKQVCDDIRTYLIANDLDATQLPEVIPKTPYNPIELDFQ